MCNKKLVYKNIVRKKKNRYKRNRLKEIINTRHRSPKQFWNLFSRRSVNKNGDISTEDFFDHFANMNANNADGNFIDENLLNIF